MYPCLMLDVHVDAGLVGIIQAQAITEEEEKLWCPFWIVAVAVLPSGQ